MARGRICTQDDDVAQHGAHTSQPCIQLTPLIFDVKDPFHAQLKAVIASADQFHMTLSRAQV